MDWKPERAVQAKVRDFQNKRKIKQKAWLLKLANGGTLCAGLQMVTSSRLWLNNELYPQKTSVATLYQVLPRQRLDWFTIIPSPRMFVECLYCDVSPPPILPVLSRFIEFACHLQSIQSYKSHSFIQITFIHTIIHSYINTFTHLCMHNIYIHGCISHPKSCLVVSFRFSLQIVSSCQS